MARGEGIRKISDLFETYKNRFVAPQKAVIDAFIDVVRDVFEVDVRAGDISYTPSTRTLSLRLPGPFKSEVLLKKEEILMHMKGRLGPKNAPRDII